MWRTLDIAKEKMRKVPHLKLHHKIDRIECATEHMTWKSEGNDVNFRDVVLNIF